MTRADTDTLLRLLAAAKGDARPAESDVRGQECADVVPYSRARFVRREELVPASGQYRAETRLADPRFASAWKREGVTAETRYCGCGCLRRAGETP